LEFFSGKLREIWSKILRQKFSCSYTFAFFPCFTTFNKKESNSLKQCKDLLTDVKSKFTWHIATAITLRDP